MPQTRSESGGGDRSSSIDPDTASWTSDSTRSKRCIRPRDDEPYKESTHHIHMLPRQTLPPDDTGTTREHVVMQTDKHHMSHIIRSNDSSYLRASLNPGPVSQSAMGEG